jgi:hypothetical protein
MLQTTGMLSSVPYPVLFQVPRYTALLHTSQNADLGQQQLRCECNPGAHALGYRLGVHLVVEHAFLPPSSRFTS